MIVRINTIASILQKKIKAGSLAIVTKKVLDP